jgi:hypothetical protein
MTHSAGEANTPDVLWPEGADGDHAARVWRDAYGVVDKTRRTPAHSGEVYCGACSAFPEPPLKRGRAGGFSGLGR